MRKGCSERSLQQVHALGSACAWHGVGRLDDKKLAVNYATTPGQDKIV